MLDGLYAHALPTLFAILAAVMIGTRKVNWYAIAATDMQQVRRRSGERSDDGANRQD
jgi:inner membrane protein involved in colicin E2 resistance